MEVQVSEALFVHSETDDLNCHTPPRVDCGSAHPTGRVFGTNIPAVNARRREGRGLTTFIGISCSLLIPSVDSRSVAMDDRPGDSSGVYFGFSMSVSPPWPTCGLNPDLTANRNVVALPPRVL